MKTEKELKENFMKIVSNITKNNSGEFVVWTKLVEHHSIGCDILKTKTENFLKLLNETKNKSEKEFDILIKRDIEDDLWYIL
jgi:hypothetical protein